MQFYFVDVFADRPYAGNPLAVFVEEDGLTDDLRQSIAREVGFSETTFVDAHPDSQGRWRVRIFTPDREIPFAGHPTLGTADVIGRILAPGTSRLVLALGVGPLPVVLQGSLWEMAQNAPTFGPEVADRRRVASLLSLGEEDLDPLPIQIASTGLPSLVIPVKNLDALNRCEVDHREFRRWLQESGPGNLAPFCRGAASADCDLSTRVFVDDTGFAEDPATGSAAGNLAGYLVEHQVFGSGLLQAVVSQGTAIHRPSRLYLTAFREERNIRVRIAGQVFPVSSGHWPVSGLA